MDSEILDIFLETNGHAVIVTIRGTFRYKHPNTGQSSIDYLEKVQVAWENGEEEFFSPLIGEE